MAKVTVKLNRAAAKELLGSDEVTRYIEALGHKVEAAAGSGAELVMVRAGGYRAVARIHAPIHGEARDGRLTRALDAAR